MRWHGSNLHLALMADFIFLQPRTWTFRCVFTWNPFWAEHRYRQFLGARHVVPTTWQGCRLCSTLMGQCPLLRGFSDQKKRFSGELEPSQEEAREDGGRGQSHHSSRWMRKSSHGSGMPPFRGTTEDMLAHAYLCCASHGPAHSQLTTSRLLWRHRGRRCSRRFRDGVSQAA